MRWLLPAVVFISMTALGGCSDTNTEPVQSEPASISVVSGSDQRGVVGADLPDSIIARVSDAKGNPVAGAFVRWTIEPASGQQTVPSGKSGLGSVSSALIETDASGRAAVSWTLSTIAGQNQVKATVGSLPAITFTATGLPGDPAAVRLLDGASSVDTLLFLALGDTIRLGAAASDRYGNSISSPELSWSSADPGIASVDGSGLVRGLVVGRSVVTTSAGSSGSEEAVSAGVVVEVFMPRGMHITGIEPALLAPGVEAVIRGGGFDATLSRNHVTVDGHRVTVTAATETQLDVTLPAAADFTCRPTGPAAVVVSATGEQATHHHPLTVASRLPVLAPGEYLNLTAAADVTCNELPQTGGSYLVSVYNTSRAPAAAVAFTLRGGEGEVSTDAAVPMASAPVMSAPAGWAQVGAGARGADESEAARRAPFAISPAVSSWSRSASARAAAHAQAHGAILEKNRELLERLGPSLVSARSGLGGGRTDPANLAAAGIGAAPGPLTPGSMVSLRVPDVRRNLCGDYLPVRARVVYAGAKAVVLEDSVAPLARTMDQWYQDLGEEFEGTMLPVLEEYFGDPLAYDATVGGGGRVLMLFSPKINDFGGLLGFISNVDLVPRGTCPASDEAQIFYAIVPTRAGTGWEAGTVNDWHQIIRLTTIHEVKHIVSFAEKLSRGATAFEETWLEEATAMIAAELWARRVFGYEFRGRTDYRSSIYCEIRPSFPECEGSPFVMMYNLVAFADYLSSTNTLSPLGSARSGDGTFYGTGWHVVRWALDHYADSEATFLKALIQETSVRGVDNLVARTGTSLPELLGPWSLSLYWDQATAPGLSTPSWDLYDLYGGLHTDLRDLFPSAYPLVTRSVTFGAFQASVNQLHGGSTALYTLTGQQRGTQLLALQGGGGGAPPSTLRMAILRID